MGDAPRMKSGLLVRQWNALADLADRAQATPDSDAVRGRHGTFLSGDAPLRIELFEILASWAPTNDDNEPAGWHKTTARPVRFISDGDGWDMPVAAQVYDETIWWPGGYQQDLAAELRAHAVFEPAASTGDWVWCIADPDSGYWLVLAPCEDMIRVRLWADLYTCQSATGNLLAAIDGAPGLYEQDISLTVWDSMGVVGASLLSRDNGAGERYLPVGTCVWVKYCADSRHWEVIAPGDCGCTSGSSSGSSSGQGCITAADLGWDKWPGYNAALKQVPFHDTDGCLGWIDVEPCPSSSGA